MVRDKDTGKSKGFCFLAYEGELACACPRMLCLNRLACRSAEHSSGSRQHEWHAIAGPNHSLRSRRQISQTETDQRIRQIRQAHRKRRFASSFVLNWIAYWPPLLFAFLDDDDEYEERRRKIWDFEMYAAWENRHGKSSSSAAAGAPLGAFRMLGCSF